MSKFKTRYINFSDRGFKKTFEKIIYDKRKSNNKINIAVTKILKEIHVNSDNGLINHISKFDNIKEKKSSSTFKSRKNSKITAAAALKTEKVKKETKKVALTTKAKKDWCIWMSSIN